MPIFAGGGPQNVLVVVNDQDLESLEIGAYYSRVREIPKRQIFHVNISTGTDIPLNTFNDEVKQPIINYINSENLQHQIDFIVFCWKYPYRISKSGSTQNALPSTMYYGFFNQLSPFSSGCSISAGSQNEYFQAETAYRHNLELFSENRYLSTLLTANNLTNTKILIDRSVSADFTHPTNKVFLLHTTDIFRNVQWEQYDHAQYLSRFLSGTQHWQIVDSNGITNESGLTGYVAGRTSLSATLFSNTYAQGSFAHHLTSYGGIISGSSQMSILEWIRAGCSGTFGTVAEPCNYTQKFPVTRLHYWYGRGFNLGESILMSVENPTKA